ncbi:cutinase family protein [Pseudonocardia petroleophila]|uniref:cutinase family protein n=1 Tax=Pseudonocardia petroleophila TaxID=37331 RepID=UPI0034E20148
MTLAAAGVTSAATAPPADAAVNCQPVLVTVAGSNQRDGSAEMDRLGTQMRAEARADGFDLAIVPVNYPAVPVTRYLRPNGSFDWDGLARSEAVGVARMKEVLRTVRACPTRTIFLAGYSQGADVVSQVVNEMTRDERRTVSVALFGNPSFLPALPQDYGSFNAKRRGARPSFGQVTHQILAPDVTARSIDACLNGDAICNYNTLNALTLFTGRSAHFRYVSSGYVDFAARDVWERRVGRDVPSEIRLDPASGPTGTVVTVTPSTPCPTGSVSASLEAVGVDSLGRSSVGADGMWRIRQQTFTGATVVDSRSGLAVAAPISWTIRVKCKDSNGAVLKQYADSLFIGTQGVAARVQVSTSTDPAVLSAVVTPTANCPVPSNGIQIFASTLDLVTYESSATESARTTTNSSGGWSSVTVNLRRFDADTEVRVGVRCLSGFGTASEVPTCFYSVPKTRVSKAVS